MRRCLLGAGAGALVLTSRGAGAARSSPARVRVSPHTGALGGPRRSAGGAKTRLRSTRRTPSPRSRASTDAKKTGGVLLSQVLADQVPSALRGLTALFGMGRGVSPSPRPPETVEKPPLAVLQNCTAPHGHQKNPSSPRPISTGLLRALPPFQIRPINLVVYQGSYSLKGMGEFISRSASRLDAFSGYPLHT